MIDLDYQSSSGDAAYLGRGWGFPPRWHDGHIDSHSQQGKAAPSLFQAVSLVSAVTDIEQAIRIILGTSIGERVMQPLFGSQLQQYVFEPLAPRTYNLIAGEVQRALTMWERRIMNVEVEVTPSAAEVGRLDVRISYLLDTHRMRQNLVYPFYVRQPEQQ